MSRKSHGGAHRRALVAVAGIGLVASALPAMTATADETPEEAESKITGDVAGDIQENGTSDLWLHFGDRPDLAQFGSLGWEAQGRAVYEALTDTAEASQADVRAQLDAQGVDYQSFYATNAIKVQDVDTQLLNLMVANDEVAGVYPDFEVQRHEPVERSTSTMAPQAVEYGIAAINADDVWEQYGVRGEGITIATIDSGVQFDHPALVNQYRGNSGDGSFDHSYNWYDAAGTGDEQPVDTDGHGTHVQGTTVGDDGEGNQIGVAPEASWIATNGCCPSDAALLDSMEWMLAPTDLDDQNADPDRRPHVVNNSWGTVLPSNAPFGEEIQEAWAAAGIFGVFSNGNSGPVCLTSGSPGSTLASYSVGAYGEDNRIAGFSSRGPGQDGEIKPNISAPGVNTRSAFPGSRYGQLSGTSMASPHVAGAVGLLWSYSPELRGDVAATQELLDQTAIDSDDPLSELCGGTTDDNNVYGEGRLDALALIEAAPAPEEPKVGRVSGPTRYETAAEIARLYPDDVDTVYVTTGEDYYDALAASPNASQGMAPMETPDGDPAPILLVESDNEEQPVKPITQTVLDEIDPANIVILGGEGAVDEAVETELEADNPDATVDRIGGEDRYQTAALLAEEYGTSDKVFVATGNTPQGYADALSGSALAGSEGVPVLLTRKDEAPQATLDAIEALGATEIVVLGGPNAVSGTAFDQLGGTDRIAGNDRYETAALIVAEFGYDAEAGNDAPVAHVATGENFPDALTGAALAGFQDAPVVLTRNETSTDPENPVPAGVITALDDISPDQLFILGGTVAVSQEAEDQLNELYPDWAE